MSLLIIIGGGTAVMATFASIGVAIGKFVLNRFGRIAVVDRRDEELFL
jgi:hypothetical protein